MQLENYVRSMLTKNKLEAEGGEDILVPVFASIESNMLITPNRSSSEEDKGEAKHTGVNNDFQRCHNRLRLSTRHRVRQQHKQRRNKAKSLGGSVKRNKSSIPIHHYNSLRVMVPSIASNTNASKVIKNSD